MAYSTGKWDLFDSFKAGIVQGNIAEKNPDYAYGAIINELGIEIRRLRGLIKNSLSTNFADKLKIWRS